MVLKSQPWEIRVVRLSKEVQFIWWETSSNSKCLQWAVNIYVIDSKKKIFGCIFENSVFCDSQNWKRILSYSILHFNKVLQIQLEQNFLLESIPDMSFLSWNSCRKFESYERTRHTFFSCVWVFYVLFWWFKGGQLELHHLRGNRTPTTTPWS